MKKRIYTILIFLFLAFSSNVEAQLNSNNLFSIPETDASEIYDVLPDRMGNIWMATHSGLMRYDGYELIRYHPDPNDSSTVGDILTHRLFEDRSGKIWIGCMDFISVFNPETNSFINYPYSHLTDFPLYSQAFVLTITQDHSGRVYFGVASFMGVIASHALLYCDENEETIKRFEYPESTIIENVYETALDPLGNVWIASHRGIFKIDTAHNLSPVSQPDGTSIAQGNLPITIKSDNSGNIWMVNNQFTLFVYNPKDKKYRSWSMKSMLDNPEEYMYVSELVVDTEDNIWMGTGVGLIFFDQTAEKFEMFDYSTTQKVKQETVYGLRFDSFGDLWFGTDSRGLIRYSKKTILKSFLSREDDSSAIYSGWAYKMFQSNDSSVWIATGGGNDYSGITLLNTKSQTITPYHFQSIMPGLQYYNAIAQVSPEEILMDSNHGHIIFDTKTKTLKKTTLDPILDSTYIFNVFTDSHDNIWYCTSNGLFLKEKENDTLHNYSLQNIEGSNITSNEVTKVWESKKNGLWLLTNHGLFLYHYDTDKIERIGNDPNKGDVFMSQDINSFYEDSIGIAWVGTWKGGLSRFNPQNRTIRTYTTADGLPSMSIQGILSDKKNNSLWLSTFEGLSRFNLGDGKFSNYSLNDGIQGLLFADESCLETSDGLFIFGGNNGITIFNPDDFATNTSPPKVFITDFKIGNTTVDIGAYTFNNKGEVKLNDISLSYDQNNISINYTGIHYDNPYKNTFSYKLENFDDTWREVGNLRTAYYYGLPPGSYTFKVKAANSNGIWNEEGASINFKISPPWWKTWWANVLYGILLIATIVALDRIQRRRLLEKAEKKAKDKELAQAKEIEKAYSELKATQTQLIHSEKMASLGELTAGIAHEIQNPLNFVNNFSEVSVDMMAELTEEMKKGNREETNAIATDLTQNLEKIHHHGKRASSIVRGMLEHSRTGNNEKHPTDINAMADEYIRLAYHGIRAKDKSFHADFKTDLDPNLPKIIVIGQDIARVVLNLINNAFYAVSAKASVKEDPDYKPLVIISTKTLDNQVEIRIKDNGGGISPAIVDKIFQPFFTTKPSGEGTGLGLSLSYDIITNGHGGKISVDTKENEGTEFIIQLPV